jgi:cysteine synthase B
MESAIVPGIYDPTLADEDLRIDTRTFVPDVLRLAREEGLLAASLRRRGRGDGSTTQALEHASSVTVFPDGAEKYLNETFLDDQ